MPGFEAAFAKYIKWVAKGKPKAEEADRERMLDAFGKFLRDHGIPPEHEHHKQLMDKMKEFAKGVGKRGPSS